VSDDEPTTEELKLRVERRAQEDSRRADKADYLRRKLDEREQSEREAAAEDAPAEDE
jgi:hypothetical protein